MNTHKMIELNDSLYKKIVLYSEIENKTPSDFINDLILDSMNKYLLMRSGGAVLTIPNPQNFVIDKKIGEKALSILRSTANEILELKVDVPIPMFAMLNFLEQRLFYELPEDEEMFKKNMMFDCTHGEIIANK